MATAGLLTCVLKLMASGLPEKMSVTMVLAAIRRLHNCVGNPDLDSYFDAVYAETFNSVSKFVVSHAARFQDSEDIIQNVYTRFYKRISEKGFADIESAEAFLINIAKFECRSVFSGFMRRKERDVILSEIDEEQSAAFEAEMSRDQKLLEDVMADKILAKQIFDDIMSGDETVGKIFYLHFVCDMKLEEVANRLDMRLSTVKTKLYRTIEKQKKKFGI